MTNTLGIKLDWQTSSNLHDLKINDDELHLWWLPLSITTTQEDQTRQRLSQAQLDKYSRRSTPQLKHAYLAGRYYLFKLLASYQQCQEEEIKFSYGRLNKPHLKSNDQSKHTSSLEFNFTDTSTNEGAYALYAFCRNKSVGVDLETQTREGDISRIAKRRFTEQELAYVTSNSGEIDTKKALAIWTRKEAYGKATGLGINFQMNQRNLIANGSTPSSLHKYHFNDGTKDWRLLQVEPNNKFIASVVHETHTPLVLKAFSAGIESL